MKNKIDFIKEVTSEEAMKFLDIAEEKGIDVGLITEWGVVISDNSEFIVEFGDEEDSSYYIATRGFLQRSKDGVFVRLKKDGKEINMPNFDDLFDIIDLSENHKEIRPKNLN